MTVIADTGAVYALIDASDAWHERVRDWWRSNREDVVLPVTILPEVSYLLQQRIGVAAELAFVESVSSGDLALEPVVEEDMPRIHQVMRKYQDAALGFVDASVVATAERLASRVVLTTDRRHFPHIRPAHARTFTLVP